MDGIDGFVRVLCEAESAVRTETCEDKNPRKEGPEMTATETKIWEMMTENTGCHILDSGGAGNRGWQQNRHIEDPREILPVSLEIWKDEVIIGYNLFPFLTAFLEITEDSEKLQQRFDEFSHSDEMEEETWFTCVNEFVEHIEDDEITRHDGENTYNHDNLLNDVIQYDILEMEYSGNELIILMTHNGCDVRGGYSTPYIFEVEDIDSFYSAMRDVSCGCKKCEESWYSDDCGYHWYSDDEGREEVPNWTLNPDENKVYHKNCGGEMEFWVL